VAVRRLRRQLVSVHAAAPSTTLALSATAAVKRVIRLGGAALHSLDFHWRTEGLEMASYRVVTVPVLSDNFAYLLIDTATNATAAVDPAGMPCAIQTLRLGTPASRG
jgi:hypothetical protein